jgi:16S rRNA (uracil1498-N3)-methyltransferase
MTAPRFFVALDLAPVMTGQTVALPSAAAHHATRVLRLAVGDALTLFTGAGGEYAAILAQVDKKGASVRLERFLPVERETPLAVTLVQGIAANDAMDYAVRKAVELGVAAVQPVTTARSAVLPAAERGERRRAHWQQVAIAACEQCGRNRVPPVLPVRSLGDWLAARDRRVPALLLAPGGTQSLPALPPPTSAVEIVVGAEGGFAPDELATAERAGLVPVRFGPRVLRTETAGVAALAALQVLWGDLR